MIRHILCFLVVAGVCGCKYSGPAPEAPKISPEKKVELLRNRAKVMGLRWKIYCVPNRDTNKTDHYQGHAVPKSQPEGATYIEEGAQDFWIGTGLTPEDAAYDLYQQLQHAADFHPGHRADPKNGDCAYQTVLDSDHRSGLPCEKEKP